MSSSPNVMKEKDAAKFQKRRDDQDPSAPGRELRGAKEEEEDGEKRRARAPRKHQRSPSPFRENR
jgi:hypothetical protein